MSFWSRNLSEIMGKLKSSAMPMYVMRNRGNNEVAPDGDMLRSFKKLVLVHGMTKELWDQYEENYLIQIGLSLAARDWMENIVTEMRGSSMNVILICFEKDATHCHRRLLAEEIKQRWPEVDYRGELTLP